MASATPKGAAAETPESGRQHAVDELIATERNYVQTLRTIVAVFANPLRASLRCGSPILNAQEMKTVFSNVEEVLSANTQLLNDLEARQRSWSSSQCIGDVFQNNVRHAHGPAPVSRRR